MPKYKVVDAGRLDAAMTATADAIREKTSGTDPIPWNADTGFAEAVAGITSGGAAVSVPMKDVNFYDYDGTLLYSYTVSEAAALTELPPLPTQPGLICQGWNWTLEDLQSYAKPYDVMPYYITEDGATWYDIENDIVRDIAVTFRWRPLGGDVSIDFGDGSEIYTDTSTTAGNTAEITHVYAVGKYRVKLTGAYNLGKANAVSDVSATSSMLLRRVFMGTYPQELQSYSFRECKRLDVCTMTRNTQWVETQVFYNCTNLRAAVLPSVPATDESMSSSVLSGCASMRVLSVSNSLKKWYGVVTMRSLDRICVPDGLALVGGGFSDCDSLTYVNINNATTALPANAFLRLGSLPRLTIPENVMTIGANAFANCTGLLTLRFLARNPPAVANANAFSNLPASCVVEVPVGTLAAYQAATNYAAIAAQMVEVES